MVFNELELQLMQYLKNEYKYRKFVESERYRFNDEKEKKYYEICQKEAEDKIMKFLKDHNALCKNLRKIVVDINDFLLFTLGNNKNIYYKLWLELNRYLENNKMRINTDRIYYYLESMGLIDDKYRNYLTNIGVG